MDTKNVKAICRNILQKRQLIEAEIQSTHLNRVSLQTGLMRAEDIEFSANLSDLFDDLEAALAATA